jgi:hypothetical protein
MTAGEDTTTIEHDIRKTREKIRDDVEALEDHLHADERVITHQYAPAILGGAVAAAILVAVGGSKGLKTVILISGALGLAAVYSKRKSRESA